MHSPASYMPFARFNGSSAYAFDGDRVRLSADIQFSPAALDAQDWALQLWARPLDRAQDAPIKLAELPLQPPQFSALRVDGWTRATPPAGCQPNALTLTLARSHAGAYSEVHDRVHFSQAESFVQPAFAGAVQHRVEDRQLCIDGPIITNPRIAENLSGTLSLELWALDAPYRSDDFCGARLAGFSLGTLGGQQQLQAPALEATLTSIPAGTNLTLLLREWTPLGAVTRDVRGIDASPVEARPAALPGGAAKASGAKPAAKRAGAKKPAAKAAEATGPDDARVSINAASAAELAALKGIGLATAANIVAARPYASLDELVRAKGIGARMIDKLREWIRL